MGFFPNFDQHVPEGRELPRKRGMLRLAELLGRDFWDIFRAGFLALLGCAPFLLGLSFAIVNRAVPAALLSGLLGGALAGPELCGLADTTLRALRDEPGFWWHIYKRAWRRSARAALLPGAAGGLLLSAQVMLLYNGGAMGLSSPMVAVLTAGILLVLALSLYLWPQLALMELSFPQLVKNSVLLFIGQLPRSLAALAIWAGYLWLSAQFLRLTLPLLPLTNLWLPALPALFLIYPGIDKNFHIEESLGGH